MSDTMEQFAAAAAPAPAPYPAAPAAAPYPAPPNAGYLVRFETPCGNLSFSLGDQERVVFMIFVAIFILVAVAYMIVKLVEEGEGKNKHE